MKTWSLALERLIIFATTRTVWLAGNILVVLTSELIPYKALSASLVAPIRHRGLTVVSQNSNLNEPWYFTRALKKNVTPSLVSGMEVPRLRSTTPTSVNRRRLPAGTLVTAVGGTRLIPSPERA